MQNKNIKRLIAGGIAGALTLALALTAAVQQENSGGSLSPAGAYLLALQTIETYDPMTGTSSSSGGGGSYDSTMPTGDGSGGFDQYDKPMVDPGMNYDSSGSYNSTMPTDGGSGGSYNPSPDLNSNNDQWNNNGDWHGTDDSNDNLEQNSAEDAAREQQNILREVQQRTRDISRIKRQTNSNPALQTLVNQLESKIQEIKNCANSGGGDMYSCWQLFEELNPIFEQANLAEEYVYLQRELKDLERTDSRELPQMEKEGVNVTNLRAKLAKIKAVVQQMMNETDREKREDLRWEKEDLWEDFRYEMENSRRQKEFAQFNEQCNVHIKREVERAKKELGRDGSADATVIAKLDGLVATCLRIVTEAQAAATSGGFIDGWEIGDKLREQVWEKLEALTRSFNEGRMCADVTRGAQGLDRGLNTEAPEILAKVPANVKPKLEELIKKGKRILGEIQAALSIDDCGKAARIMQDAEELQWQFEEIMRSAGLNNNLINYEDDYKDMYDDFADADFDMNEDKFKQFMKDKRFGVNEMDRMKKLSKDVLADYIENTVDTDDNTLAYASTAGLENTKLQALIQAKSELMVEVQALRSQVQNLKQEIQNITAELGSYNFGIGAAKDAAKNLAGRIVNLGEAEAVEEFRQIKEQAITQKVEDGLIGFRDADDTTDNWFASFALKSKNEGLINGNADGTLNPGGTLNYSEAAVALGRIAGLDGQTSNSTVANNLADWATEGVGALEQKGVNLDFMSRVQAGDAIKREEVAILLSEVLKLENATISDAGFSDLGQAPARAQQAIANVNAAGIMTGKGGTDEFGVGENLSRAALTKVLAIAAEKIEK